MRIRVFLFKKDFIIIAQNRIEGSDFFGDVILKAKMGIRLGGWKKIEYIQFIMGCADTIDTTKPLHDAGWIPGQVVIYDSTGPVQIHAFSKHIGSNQNAEIFARVIMCRIKIASYDISGIAGGYCLAIKQRVFAGKHHGHARQFLLQAGIYIFASFSRFSENQDSLILQCFI